MFQQAFDLFRGAASEVPSPLGIFPSGGTARGASGAAAAAAAAGVRAVESHAPIFADVQLEALS